MGRELILERIVKASLRVSATVLFVGIAVLEGFVGSRDANAEMELSEIAVPLNADSSDELGDQGRERFLSMLRGSRWGIDRASVSDNMTDSADYDCSDPMVISITDNGIGWKRTDPTGDEHWAEIISVDRWNGEWSLIIRYDEEARKDPQGNPFAWRLVMIDENRFFWRSHSSTGSVAITRSKIRQRCQDAPDIE